ncbi:RHS repeat protein [Desulfonema ishimotonii]|uniref:RHS repeat protein n=1 Tax=Desulfonema ishimotonii TaxID=45657 RepID=A0A401FZY8_9BACT|nr:RHS domain-containing protein [Desulfonema ishimotonii]GBC62552.1 RHS repeat protein [Desulfonema ishimotonii]
MSPTADNAKVNERVISFFPISRTDGRNITVTYQYDALNRLTNVIFPDTSENITYGYDAGAYGKGKLTSVADPSGTLTYAYNALGMVTQETRVTGGQTYVTTYSYDSTTGEMSGMTYPGGLALMYGRDANGQVDEIASGAAVVVRDVKYMPFGPVREMTFGDGVLTASATYNERYLPTRIQAGSVTDYQYTEYTGSGEVKAVTGVTLPDLTAETTSYTPASDSNRMTDYTYDGAGNIISDGTRTFDYNQRGRLARVSEGSTVLAEYEYDVFGRRVKKTAGSVTTFFHYDLNGLLIAETGADGSPLKYYVWLNGQPAAMKVAGSGGAWYYFLNDHLGTPQKLVNSYENVAWEAAYLPFGEAQILTENVENNLRFPGQH